MVQNTQMTSNGWNADAVASDPTLLGNTVNTTGNGFIDPQVLTAMVSAQLPNFLRFSPLATVDNTLVGRPGTTITVPRWTYIGEAKDIKELGQIPLQKLNATTQTISIKKAGTGTELSDEMLLSAYGDPRSEAGKQIALSIADHIDNDCMNTLLKAKLTLDTNNNLDLINALDAKFIENTSVGVDTTEQEAMLNGVVVMNPEDANDLISSVTDNYSRPTTLGDNVLMRGNGALGTVLGWQIITARKLTKGQAVAMKPGALGIYMKRGVVVETQRDIDHKATKITADEYYATAINDDAKVCAITLKPTSSSASTSSSKG